MRMRRASPTLLWSLGLSTLGAVVVCATVPIVASAYDVPLLITFVAASAQGVAFPLILTRPIEATLLQFGAVVAFAVAMPADPAATWPLTIPGMIALIVHVGLIGMRHSWRAGVITWWGSALLLILIVVLDPRAGKASYGDASLIIYTTDSVLLLIAAMVVRHWSGIRRQLAEARRDIAVEQSQRAVAEERTRIARELHDVVAHSMSVIHMQATSASYRLKNADEESKAEFASIAAGARTAMREMRQLLAVLRDSSDPALAPVPGLSELSSLVASTQQAGVPVSLSAPALPDISETVAAAAYRIVQESLSNVIRHAPGASATVSLSVNADDLLVLVCNTPGGVGDEPSPGGGHGLHGMRERVRLLGGSLETGPLDEGGYRVAARLPLGLDGGSSE